MIMNNKLFFVTIMMVLITIVGCGQSIPKFPDTGTKGTFEETSVFNPEKDISAISFKSVDELNNFLKNRREGYSRYGSFALSKSINEESAVRDMAPAAPAYDQQDYSKTNVQVEGIDEADIIKTDGTYIYTVSDNMLFIIYAYPGEDGELVYSKKIEDSFQIQGLFVNGNYLAVFGTYNDPSYFREAGIKPYSGMTFFNIYDISEKNDPDLIKEYKFEGAYFESRMKDDFIYLITNIWPQYRREYPTPIIMDGSKVSSIPISDIYYFPIPYESPMLSTIHAININDPEQELNSKSLMLEGSQNMYMSQNNIYITYPKYINEWEFRKDITLETVYPLLSEDDKLLIGKIKGADDSIMSQFEKENKIMGIINEHITYYMTDAEQEELNEQINKDVKEKLKEYEFLEYTVIHRVSIDGNKIEVEANGKVPGHIINQFSMDEYDNVFMIATTVNPRFDVQPMEVEDVVGVEIQEAKPSRSIAIMPRQRTLSTINNIFTLNQELEILDKLTDLAEGETIQSTRFIGDRLYMVTFRQIDPFFVIDLSNPNNIKELGKLKIPGFSRYLHPFDKDTIIGIGRDASESGNTEGLKISLFDVSDVEDPKETAKFVTREKYAQSTAEYEHKAFLFSKEKELLVIPSYSYDYDGNYDDDRESYNGAMVFKITEDEIKLRGIIDHSQGIKDYYGPRVERSLYIEELLYTKSPSMLRINRIANLEKVKNIDLKSDKQSQYDIY